MFKWLGLIITLAVWAGLAVLLVRWRNRKLDSISAHGASAPGASLFFKLLLVVGGLLYYVWLVGWFVPHLHLPVIFTVLLTVVVAYQIAAGLNNGKHGLSKDVHDYTSQTMALLYIPLAVLIVESSRLSTLSHVVCAALLVYMVNSYVLVEIMKRFKAQHLMFQLLYIVAFQLLILTSAYLT